jgi:signal peptidase I
MESFPINDIQDLVGSCLSTGKSMRFHVFSNSMFPCIQAGDSILVRHGNANEIHPGTIVVVRKGDLWLTHRIVYILKNANSMNILTKGDNNSVADTFCQYPSDIGIVVSLSRGGKRIDFTSARSRIGARFIAWLSHLQSVIHEYPFWIIRRSFINILGMLIFVNAKIFYSSTR